MKHTNIAIRLEVLGLTLRDLSNAVNDRLREQGRPEIHYTILSRTISGYREKRGREALALADKITAQWMTEYAREHLRVLKPRLEQNGINTDDLMAKTVVDQDCNPAIVFVNLQGRHVASYHPMSDLLAV
jgi:hypothetical protein